MKSINKYTAFMEMLLNVFRNKQLYENLLIFGDRNFIDATIAALNLLKKQDPKAYGIVNDFVDAVSQKKNFPFINIQPFTRTCFVGSEIANSSQYSYASHIAQQAFYVYLLEKIKKENPRLRRIPEELWCKGRGRRQALEFRKNVLKNIDAPYELLEYVEEEINNQNY